MIRKLVLPFAALALFMFLVPPQVHAQMKLSAGFYERLRHEYWLNNRDLNSQGMDAGDRNFLRFKTSVWGQADYEKLLTLYAKVTNEWKVYSYYGGNAKKGIAGENDEILFDSLYFDIKKPADIPVSFRLGRQDLMYGESFLICDGTPGDGSRTYYFNAVKASWNVDEKNTLDLIWLNDPVNDQYLPIIDPNKPKTALGFSDEAGFIVYVKNKAIQNLSFEPYYIYKREGAGAVTLQNNTSDIHTFGVFAKYIADPWTFHAQLADQTGSFGAFDRQALGGYGFADYALKDIALTPVLTAGVLYLSGDDKSTVKNEGWDPLFSRAPIWSEIIPQTYQNEAGNGYWTNLMMYRAQAAFTVTKQAKLTLIYSFLRANEQMAATTFFSGTGKNRGSLYQAKVDYTLNKNVCGYILGEYFVPGNFYTNTADDGAIFVRTQIEFKF